MIDPVTGLAVLVAACLVFIVILGVAAIRDAERIKALEAMLSAVTDAKADAVVAAEKDDWRSNVL